MIDVGTLTDDDLLVWIVHCAKGLLSYTRHSAKAAKARSELPPGSSRAKVTTANARWSSAAEARDLAARQLSEAVREAARRSILRGVTP